MLLKRKLIKYGVQVTAFIALAVFFCPKPLISDVKGSDIISIMYRADTYEELHYFYPTQNNPTINESELLQILNQRKAIVEVFPPTMIDGIPSDVVTLLISVSDGDQIKYVLLGEWNRMTIQSSHTTYRILNANSVLEQVLDFLQIDKGSDS